MHSNNARSLVDCVLANAILIPACPPLPPTTIGKARETIRKLVTEKHLLVNEKRYVGMAKRFSKKYGNKA